MVPCYLATCFARIARRLEGGSAVFGPEFGRESTESHVERSGFGQLYKARVAQMVNGKGAHTVQNKDISSPNTRAGRPLDSPVSGDRSRLFAGGNQPVFRERALADVRTSGSLKRRDPERYRRSS
jgi:hypothetical protein